MLVDAPRLLETLIALPRETEWLEFKQNQFDPDDVGKYVSGLANSAMLHDEAHGYLIFGVEDGTHRVVGTGLRLKEKRVGGAGGEPFENWLSKLLHPTLHVEFIAFEYEGQHIEMLRIHPAYMSPVRFKTEAYIRVDSSLKPLRDHQERERALWAITSRFTFERGVAAAHLSAAEVFELFDPVKLLTGLGVARLSSGAIVGRLVDEGLLIDNKQGGFDASNLLVLLAAKDITRFPTLARKMARVFHYRGTSKSVGIDEVSGVRGYGLSFPALLAYIMDRIEHKEEMLHGTRTTVYAIPEISMREFVVNALIHQDLTSQGDGPFIEIYSDRVRITNPGKPLVAPDRLIDAPAKSRNEALAGYMRRLGYFEGRGSGVDRAIEAIEKAALTPPLFQVVESSMVVTVFAARSFAAMTKEDRIRACYQHACVRWEAGMPMSNQSLRDRFGLSQSQYTMVSQVISDAREANQIKPQDEGQANRVARYLPYWA